MVNVLDWSEQSRFGLWLGTLCRVFRKQLYSHSALSIQVYEWVLVNLIVRGGEGGGCLNLPWACIPSRG